MADAPLATSARPARRAGRPTALVRRLVEEVCNGGDLTVLDELLPSADGVGSAGRLRELVPAFRAAVPDARWAIVEQVAAGNTVVTRLAVRGTFAGGLVGLAAPGRPATLSGVAISRFMRGQLVGLWMQADLLGLLQQLGVLPPLSLTQAVAMAQVLHAGALLADEAAPAPPDPRRERGPANEQRQKRATYSASLSGHAGGE